MTEVEKKIYEDSLEDWPQASKEIKEAYQKMYGDLEEYLNAIQLQAFCYGYELGRKEGV